MVGKSLIKEMLLNLGLEGFVGLRGGGGRKSIDGWRNSWRNSYSSLRGGGEHNVETNEEVTCLRQRVYGGN